jgi:excisionase family DNA binding protein
MKDLFADYPEVLTISDLQKILGVGRNTAYSLIRHNKIKSVQIGRQRRILKCYVLEYLLYN